MPIARFRSFMGIAKEATPGTPVSPTDYITLTSDPKPKDTYTKLDDKSWRGSAVSTYAKVVGQRKAEISIDGNVNPSTIGYLLGSLLPDLSTTAANTTTLSLGTTASSGGTFAAGAEYWVITALGAWGESGKSNEVTATLVANGTQVLNWVAVVGATGYKIYRGTTPAGESVLVTTIGSGATITYTDTGTSSGAGTPPAAGTFLNTHAFAVRNVVDGQPTSFTLTDFNGDQAKQYAAAKFEDLAFKFSADGLITYAAKAKCWASSVAGSIPTPSYSTVDPMAAWTGVVSLSGAPVPYVMSGELSIKRPVEVLQTINGIQDPYALFSGAVSVTGKFSTVWQTNDPNYQNYIGATGGGYLPIDIKFTQPNSSNSLQLHCSKAAYTMVEYARGKDYVEGALSFEAVGSTSDAGASAGYSPIKATLTNMVASGTYQ
ncbi:phage tail tube protein [Nocardia sp. NPDC046763]|uniref:phage tail tube protein n=1 Tax=Nocardia sp. NPDC046763 TaxID=3155256 RepID=UPI0033E546B9